MTKPAGAPLVLNCKIIPDLYEVACLGKRARLSSRSSSKDKGVWFSLNLPERTGSDHSFVQRKLSLVTFGAKVTKTWGWDVR